MRDAFREEPTDNYKPENDLCLELRKYNNGLYLCVNK